MKDQDHVALGASTYQESQEEMVLMELMVKMELDLLGEETGQDL